MLKWFAITGISAAVALLAPMLVFLGFLAGGLPGVWLAAAPTLFGYMFVSRALYVVLPETWARWRAWAAFGLALSMGIVAALPIHRAGKADFEQALLPDVVPARPVPIAGHVRLTYHASSMRRVDGQDVADCDGLCAAVLATPGVTGVTVISRYFAGGGLPPVTYRLRPAQLVAGKGLAPSQPENILDELYQEIGGIRPTDREAKKAAIVSGWALRLAGAERLTADLENPPPDWRLTILWQSERGRARIAVQEVTAVDRVGRVHFRRRRVAARVVTPPLAWVPGETGPQWVAFGLFRWPIARGSRAAEQRPLNELFAHVAIANPMRIAASPGQMREQIEAALTAVKPRPDDPRLTLVDPWLETRNWRALGEADLQLIARLILSPAVTDLKALSHNYDTDVSPTLRDAIVRRLAEPDLPPTLGNQLNWLIRRMPAGTFGTMTRTEKKTVADQTLRLAAPALVERLVDQGAAAVPTLILILRADARVEPWSARQWSIRAVRRVLTRLGPAAASAIPAVDQLMPADGHNPLADTWSDAEAWRVALARMGKPVDALHFPSHLSPREIADQKADIRLRADRIATGHFPVED